MRYYLLRGQFVRMLAIAAFVVSGSGCRPRRGCAGPGACSGASARTGRDACARHRACHDQRAADHRGRPRAGAERSRPAIRAAAGRAAPRRRHVGDHRDQAARRKGDRRRHRQVAGIPAADRIPAAALAAQPAGRRRGRRQDHRPGDPRPLRPGGGQYAAGQRGACPPHPGEDQGRGRGDHQAARRRRQVRGHRQGEIVRRFGRARRRPRLVRPGTDGAGIREGGVRARGRRLYQGAGADASSAGTSSRSRTSARSSRRPSSRSRTRSVRPCCARNISRW